MNTSVISQRRICRNRNHAFHTLLAPAPSPTAAATKPDDAAAGSDGCSGFESPEPREPLGTSGTSGAPQRGQAASLTQPRAPTAPVPALLPSGQGQTSAGGRCQAGPPRCSGAGLGGRARRLLARAIVCWPGTKARPGDGVGWFPSSTAAGLQRRQRWDFAVPASGCKGSGGLGRGWGARRRQLPEL